MGGPTLRPTLPLLVRVLKHATSAQETRSLSAQAVSGAMAGASAGLERLQALHAMGAQPIDKYLALRDLRMNDPASYYTCVVTSHALALPC